MQASARPEPAGARRRGGREPRASGVRGERDAHAGRAHVELAAGADWEYALLALVTATFAVVMGSALAAALLRLRLELDAGGLYWTGAVTAFAVSVLSLAVGAQVLLAQLRLTPASLLRSGG